jgi:circadian clock protein KaiB
MSQSVFKFRLYVAGDSPNSLQAVTNLHAFCREHLPARHEIELVDVLQEPRRALADNILLTPMLVKLAPAPERRIIGNLSRREVLLTTLGFNGAAP